MDQKHFEYICTQDERGLYRLIKYNYETKMYDNVLAKIGARNKTDAKMKFALMFDLQFEEIYGNEVKSENPLKA